MFSINHFINQVIRVSSFLALSVFFFPVMANNNTFMPDKVFLEKVIVRLGTVKANVDTEEVNGGVLGVNEPDTNGITFNLSAVFSNDYSPSVKPYAEFSRSIFSDRNFNIFSLGVRHDFLTDTANLEYYISGGLGYMYMIWEESPFPAASAGLAGSDSLDVNFQGGLEYYFSPHLALDVNLRIDAYNHETLIVENSNLGVETKFIENYSISALVGLVYHFQKKSASYARKDTDHDGVINRYDQCADTLYNVPVNNVGCTLKEFRLTLRLAHNVFSLEYRHHQPNFHLIEFMRKHPTYKLELHQCSGNKDKVVEHSIRNIESFLIDKGLKADRISLQLATEDLPNIYNESKALNQCVDIRFYQAAE